MTNKVETRRAAEVVGDDHVLVLVVGILVVHELRQPVGHRLGLGGLALVAQQEAGHRIARSDQPRGPQAAPAR